MGKRLRGAIGVGKVAVHPVTGGYTSGKNARGSKSGRSTNFSELSSVGPFSFTKVFTISPICFEPFMTVSNSPSIEYPPPVCISRPSRISNKKSTMG